MFSKKCKKFLGELFQNLFTITPMHEYCVAEIQISHKQLIALKFNCKKIVSNKIGMISQGNIWFERAVAHKNVCLLIKPASMRKMPSSQYLKQSNYSFLIEGHQTIALSKEIFYCFLFGTI